jgi:hypothetical protein
LDHFIQLPYPVLDSLLRTQGEDFVNGPEEGFQKLRPFPARH